MKNTGKLFRLLAVALFLTVSNFDVVAQVPTASSNETTRDNDDGDEGNWGLLGLAGLIGLLGLKRRDVDAPRTTTVNR